MIKRVNFTGRRRIPRDRVQIDVYDGQPRVFDAEINLGGLDLLERAKVILEATCAGSTVVDRFEFGEVNNVHPPLSRVLDGLDGKNVLFALKVVDTTKRFGRLVGVAEKIRPIYAGEQTETARTGILPIEQVDLGQHLWKLDFGEHDVTLFINKLVPELADRVRSDPQFYAAVYPEILRRILERAIHFERAEIDDDSDRWPALWLRFGRNLHPSRDEPPNADDQEACDEWIEEIAQSFCERHSLRTHYLRAIGEIDEVEE